MTAEEWEEDHPELDWEKLYHACLYALQHLHVADLKESDTAPCSADEHRSMAFRRLREALRPKEGTA